jgi:transposase-like protein
VAEQRYQAVLAVIADGLSVSQVAEKVGVSRQTVHAWLARYEAEGLEGLADRSHRPARCPHQMPAQVEAALLELRRTRPYWGPRRLVHELGKRGVAPLPSPAGAYRADSEHLRLWRWVRLAIRTGALRRRRPIHVRRRWRVAPWRRRTRPLPAWSLPY